LFGTIVVFVVRFLWKGREMVIPMFQKMALYSTLIIEKKDKMDRSFLNQFVILCFMQHTSI
jgi:hypothetical protein